MNAQVRQFETGATRSADASRYDPEGFLSPLAIERYCEYMNKHRLQPDGSIRASDNWQKGIPLSAYAKGGWRHFLHFWTRHRGLQVQDPGAAEGIEEDLCALLFNIQGYLHELVKQRLTEPSPQMSFTLLPDEVESTFFPLSSPTEAEREEIWNRRHKSMDNG